MWQIKLISKKKYIYFGTLGKDIIIDQIKNVLNIYITKKPIRILQI